MSEALTLAVAQGPMNRTGPEQRIQWLAHLLDTLSGKEIDLLLLPELFVTGYNMGEKLMQWAEPVDGAIAEKIAELAIQHQLAIHYGFPEKDFDGFYNAAQCIAADGQTLCHQRKLMLPPGFEGNHFTAGQGCCLFSLKGFNIATLICYDAEFPETFRQVAEMGAHLVLVPTALGAQWEHVATKVIPTRAFENGVYVAYANHAGSEQGIQYLGQSCIIGPDCSELARAGEGEEVLIAQLDLGNITTARERLPYLIDRKKYRF